MSPPVAPAPLRPTPLAKRKVARRPLSAVTARNRSRRARASASHTKSRKASASHTKSRKESPASQAQPPTRAAPIRGYRLRGKRSPPLPRKAWAQATRILQRCPNVASNPRTLQSENPKAPARNAARALPDPPRSDRQTAKPCQERQYLRLVCTPFLVYAVPKHPITSSAPSPRGSDLGCLAPPAPRA